MKIAVTTEGNQVFQHFGKCPTFTLFTIENGNISDKKLLDAAGSGHATLSGFLKGSGVDVVICGGIGGGAKNMLSSVGIQLIAGVVGNIDDAVNAYLAGKLSDQGGSCNHEEHDRNHECSCENHCH